MRMKFIVFVVLALVLVYATLSTAQLKQAPATGGKDINDAKGVDTGKGPNVATKPPASGQGARTAKATGV